MELVSAQVKGLTSKVFNWNTTILMPIGDLQYGAQGSNTDLLKRDLEWGMKNNAYFIGMGDLADVFSPSNRKLIKSVPLYDSGENVIKEYGLETVEELTKLFHGTEGRWLGLLEGHHFMEFEDGTTTDTRLAEKLKAPFLGNCAILRLNFKRHTRSTLNYNIWLHHGHGSGATLAAPLNKLERLASRWGDIDLFMIGHYHRAGVARIDQPFMSAREPYKLVHRTVRLVCTGSYMRGYMVGNKIHDRPNGTYVEKKMLPPSDLGGVKIFLTPTHTKTGDFVDSGVLV